MCVSNEPLRWRNNKKKALTVFEATCVSDVITNTQTELSRVVEIEIYLCVFAIPAQLLANGN